MINPKLIKPVAGFSLAIIIVAQLATVFTVLLMPKPAEAFLGIGDLTFDIQIGNTYDILKDVGLGALRQVAINFANKFLTKFVSKLQDKYKIQNYLYYDQILTNYYLNNYISDKINDPDLRNIYGLLSAGLVTGTQTGTNNAPDPNKALIPLLKTAISNYYINHEGGIDPIKIYSPSPRVSDREYFSTAQAYFSNPQSFTETNLRGQFGAFQSSATTAAQLEVIVGNGLKAGRIVGGTCSTGSANSGGSPSTDTPATCQARGGTWQPSALDQVRSFIQNPTTFTASWMDSAIKQITGNNFDPNSYAAVLGSFIGDFLFHQLTIDKVDGTLNETPTVYNPTAPTPDPTYNSNGTGGKGIDIDGDGIIDGYDTNNDGQPDICVFGGIPSQDSQHFVSNAGPPCLGSKAAVTVTNPTPPTSECSPAPTAAQTREAQAAIDFMIPLLNAIPPMNPVVSPPPADYQAAVENIVSQSNSRFPGAQAVYTPYVADNVIAMVFNYIVGPADHVVSNQVGIGTTWRNAWRVTCTTTPPGGGGSGANAHSTPDQTQAVIAAKNSVIASGITPDPNNACATFEITRRAAINVGAGVLEKGAGFGCTTPVGHFSTDIIVFSNGDLIDVLSSSLNPQWLADGTTAGCSTECHYVNPNTVPAYPY